VAAKFPSATAQQGVSPIMAFSHTFQGETGLSHNLRHPRARLPASKI